MSAYSLRFLGVGSAQARELGSACAVLERDARPLLLIDAGFGSLDRFARTYGELPEAAFITHAHLDHIGDLEAWFYKLAFDQSAKLPRLYLPASLVALLQRRIADFPNWVAEGGRNFWDVFQMIPVSDWFWHQGLRFAVFPVRHHAPDSAFGLAVHGSFVFSGDTRPIPEQLSVHAAHGERVFHDCSPQSNPSHTGLADLHSNYLPELIARMVLYHYPDVSAAGSYRNAGFDVAETEKSYGLPAPIAEALEVTWSHRSRR